MSSPSLLPQAFWFRWTFACPRVDGIPRKSEVGRLLDLPESCKLPAAKRLEGETPWSDVRVAWNPGGLAIQAEVTGKVAPISYDPYVADNSDELQVWIDTRDTRDVHRATRFCHRFRAAMRSDRGGKALDVLLDQSPIHRALADAPLSPPGSIQTRVEKMRSGWRVEMFLAAEALNGFDPETNRRLGFFYQVTDPDRGAEFLGVGRDFPVGEDPSLWATLELTD